MVRRVFYSNVQGQVIAYFNICMNPHLATRNNLPPHKLFTILSTTAFRSNFIFYFYHGFGSNADLRQQD